jgi:hypothetical protein
MRPKWFHVDEIPYDEMWSDDKLWLPFLLNNKKFKGYFLFNADEKTILNYQVNEIDSL